MTLELKEVNHAYMLKILRVIFVVLMLIAFWHGANAHAQERTHTGKIPFTAMTRHGGPIITVRLNNTTDAKFLIDTGSNNSGISEALANRMKLKREGMGSREYVTISSFRLSDWNLNGAMVILPNTALNAFYGQIDGILGTNILADFALTLDFENQQCLITYPGNLSPERAKAAGFDKENVSVAPLSPGSLEGDYNVPIEIEGNKTSLLLDTGSVWTLLPPDYSAKLKRKPISEREVGTVEGLKPIAIFPVKSVSVDKSVVTDTTCKVLKKSGSSTVLGLDFLSHFVCLIDFPGKRIYLKPAASNPSLWENSSKLIYGMTIRPNKAGDWMVTEVLEGVFRKAGVLVGDRLLQVNGLNIAGMSPDEIAQALADSIKATITIKRGAEIENRTLTVMPER